MKKLIPILVCLALVGVSCMSGPDTQENKDFQKETGMSLTFAKRGLYSLPRPQDDEGFQRFYNKFIDNEIIFSVNGAQSEWATFVEKDGLIFISVNDLFKRYNQSSNNALLTSTIYAIGLIKIGEAPANIEARFYKIISDYQNYGVNVSMIINDVLFKEGKFKVVNNGIRCQS